MPQIVNTNVASLNAQRNLNRSQSLLSTSLARISSGMRVNSARDDAAGLAISNRMTAQIRGFAQAARNAADAISLAQTGEGALAEVTNNLQRMRELAVQSRNATNTASDRRSLDAEFQQLLAENDRIATTTAFNGRKILDGSLGSSVFQIGANVGETISVDVSTSMRSNSIGGFATVSYALVDHSDTDAGDDLDIVNAGDLIINGTNIAAPDDSNAADGRGHGSAISIAAAINLSTGTTGVTAVATAASQTFANTVGNFAFTNNDAAGDLSYTLTINGQQILQHNEGDAALSVQGLANAINSQQANTGVTASVSSNGNDLTLTAADGRNIEILEVLGGGDNAADQVVGYFGNTQTNAAATNFNAYKGGLTLSGNVAQISVQTATGANADVIQGVDDDGAASVTTASTIDASNVLDESSADQAMNRIDQALTDVDVLRGTFGAIQSRFESTIRNLETASENASAARSRIVDADFAAETAALTRAQILQQAGVAILAQANALPQNALALLQ